MSQTDLNVANGSGATVRADINAHLQAIAELSSGATAPTTMFANQWWADTSTNILKRRNNANTAWISVMSLATGLIIGTDVQAQNAYLADIAGITPSQGDVLYFNGTDWANLAAGTAYGVLQTNGAGANPSWHRQGILRMRLSAAQTITTATTTKIIFDASDADTESFWDGTNYWFKPTRPSTWLITSALYVSGLPDQCRHQVILRKNGTNRAGRTDGTQSGTSGANSLVTSAIVEFNGSTDYLYADYYHEKGSNQDVGGGAENDTYFHAIEILR